MASIDNKQDIVTAWTSAVLIHVLFFSFTGKMSARQPQFAIAPSRVTEDSLSVDTELRAIDINLIDGPKEVVKVREETKLVVKKVEKTIPKMPKPVMTSRAQVKVEAKPYYIQNPAPPYPELAKQMHQEGIVMLSVDVNKEGDPVDVAIIQGSGFRLLDQAAVKAVRHWKFQPGRIGDLPMESHVTVPVRFRLEQ